MELKSRKLAIKSLEVDGEGIVLSCNTFLDVLKRHLRVLFVHSPPFNNDHFGFAASIPKMRGSMFCNLRFPITFGVDSVRCVKNENVIEFELRVCSKVDLVVIQNP